MMARTQVDVRKLTTVGTDSKFYMETSFLLISSHCAYVAKLVLSNIAVFKQRGRRFASEGPLPIKIVIHHGTAAGLSWPSQSQDSEGDSSSQALRAIQ